MSWHVVNWTRTVGNAAPMAIAVIPLPTGPKYIDSVIAALTQVPFSSPALEANWMIDPNGGTANGHPNVIPARDMQALPAYARSPLDTYLGTTYPICHWAPENVRALRLSFEYGGIDANTASLTATFWTLS